MFDAAVLVSVAISVHTGDFSGSLFFALFLGERIFLLVSKQSPEVLVLISALERLLSWVPWLVHFCHCTVDLMQFFCVFVFSVGCEFQFLCFLVFLSSRAVVITNLNAVILPTFSVNGSISSTPPKATHRPSVC